MKNKFFLDALSESDARWDGKQEIVLFGLKNNFRTTPSQNFLNTPQNVFNGYIFINMSCVLTFSSLLLLANCKRDKFGTI